ncbi:MAG: hypothetical protein ACE5I0_02635 [Candidatus Binatia bacterium]
MKAYPISFILFLHQLSLGGLFALAVTPFHEIERGFYKSTAGVLLITSLLGLWGKLDLYRKAFVLNGGVGPILEMLLYVLFVLSLALYLISLWGERVRLRARIFSSSLLLGLGGLLLASFSFHKTTFWSVETFFYPISFVLSSLLLGAAIVGMLIGHWYLIDSGQSLEPFLRTFKYFVVVLIVQTSFLVVSPVLFYLLGSHETIVGLNRLWRDHTLLISARFLVSQVGPLVISYMIWQTLKIPNTMAATGLFYIALLGVIVGEILGRRLLALTSLPL